MRLLIALLLVLAGILVLEKWRPYAPSAATSTLTVTPLPDNFTLIPTFTPAFPCDLQNVEVHNDQLCRYESVSERNLSIGRRRAVHRA